MNKILLSTLCLAMAYTASAQDTYQSATLVDNDLNGTARYVGMGGAMEALGADITTMGTNPAGIGLVRRSTASVTAGVNNISGCSSLGEPTTKASFDQLGLVLTAGGGSESVLNFGFNYRKSKNFNTLLDVSDRLNLASQNKLSCIKYYDGLMCDENYSQVDYLYNTLLNGVVDKSGNIVKDFDTWYNSDSYRSQRVESGYVSDFDFNISGSYNDQFYWGLTVGIQDLHYNNTSLYMENILAGDDKTRLGTVELSDSRVTSGTGANIKLGFIYRPVYDSGFRFGGYIHTPTWYKLTTSNYTTLYNNLPKDHGNYDECQSDEYMDFKTTTPWRFGLSMGHTIGNILALGATYEYADYGAIDNRIITGETYDGYEYSDPDRRMNVHTKESLKGVHTVKVGAELKLTSQLALRAGYNYLSPKYKEDAFRDVTIYSPGTYMSSTTDYTNWEATNRVTAGLGYNVGSFFLDLAYQYSNTNGNYYPFASYYSNDEYNNVCDAVKVSNTHHQVLMTLGFRF